MNSSLDLAEKVYFSKLNLSYGIFRGNYHINMQPNCLGIYNVYVEKYVIKDVKENHVLD